MSIASDPAGSGTETPRRSHLLYLHGFRSSPRSAKAVRMQTWVAAHRPDLHFACPQLPPSPRAAFALLQTLTQDWPAERSAVMGSSLGGFYTSALIQDRPGWRAVVINPAVDPARDLAAYIGEQSCWQDPAERFFFQPEFVDELRTLRPERLLNPERCLAVVAKGDELLDWREMQARYAAGPIQLLEGSDHGLSDFEDHLEGLVRFLQL
jgi:hypothetical protein